MRGDTPFTLQATLTAPRMDIALPPPKDSVAATRIRMASMCPVANLKTISNWADLGFPEIGNSACLFPVVLTSTTSSGTLRGGGKIAHG